MHILLSYYILTSCIQKLTPRMIDIFGHAAAYYYTIAERIAYPWRDGAVSALEVAAAADEAALLRRLVLE
jgi:hypothetical protein